MTTNSVFSLIDVTINFPYFGSWRLFQLIIRKVYPFVWQKMLPTPQKANFICGFTNRSRYLSYQIIDLPSKSDSCVIGWAALPDEGIRSLRSKDISKQHSAEKATGGGVTPYRPLHDNELRDQERHKNKETNAQTRCDLFSITAVKR
jgi:hypothetical protein